jgi:NmrA-like family
LFLLIAGVPDELVQSLIAYGLSKKAGLKQVTYASVFKADQFLEVPHFAAKYAVEEAIRAGRMPYTILRPAYFLQNERGLKAALTGAGAPCVEVVLYLGRTNDAGLLDFYHRSRELLGGRLTHYQAEGMKGFRKLNERGEAMVPTWFTNPRKGKNDYYMLMAQDDPNEMASASRLHLSAFRKPEEEVEKDRKEWASIYQKVPASARLCMLDAATHAAARSSYGRAQEAHRVDTRAEDRAGESVVHGLWRLCPEPFPSARSSLSR